MLLSQTFMFAHTRYIRVRTIQWCHIKIADVDGGSLLGEAPLWAKFNGIIEWRTRTKEQEIWRVQK